MIAPSPTPSTAAVRTVNLTKVYGRCGAMVRALRGVNTEVKQGERGALFGK
jgi:hypothetical protein